MTSGLRRAIEAVVGDPDGDLGTAADFEFGANVVDVRVDRALAQDQLLADLAIGQALGNEDGNFPLAI